MERHVALTGFMAAGKSSVGRRLAADLGVPFIDTDESIVAAHGPIADIFARDGEAAFRERELEAVRAALDAPPAVIALGGGAVTHPPTHALLQGRALRIFLDVPIDVVLMRLRHAATVRPLIGAEPREARIRALHAERLPLYRQADLIVDCGRRSSSAVAKHLAARLRDPGRLTV